MAGIGTLVAGLAVATAVRARGTRAPAALAGAEPRPRLDVAAERIPGSAVGRVRVVVRPFENRSGDRRLDLLGGRAADAIVGGLAGTALADAVDAAALAGAPGEAGRTHAADARAPT